MYIFIPRGKKLLILNAAVSVMYINRVT